MVAGPKTRKCLYVALVAALFGGSLPMLVYTDLASSWSELGVWKMLSTCQSGPGGGGLSIRSGRSTAASARRHV